VGWIAVSDFVPGERRRDTRVPGWAHRVRSGDGAVFGVLVVVDEHALPFLFPPLAGGDLRGTPFDFACQRERAAAQFVETPAPFKSDVHVHAARTGSLGPADEMEVFKDTPGHQCDLQHLFPRDPWHGIEIDTQLVGMLEVLGTYRVWVQLEATEVREPGQRRRVTRHDLLRRAARGKAQLDHLDPRWAAPGRALLVEVLAVDALRVANEHVGTATNPAERSLRDGDVVADQIELGVLRLREQELVRVGDRKLTPGEQQDLSVAVSGHHDSSYPSRRAQSSAAGSGPSQ